MIISSGVDKAVEKNSHLPRGGPADGDENRLAGLLPSLGFGLKGSSERTGRINENVKALDASVLNMGKVGTRDGHGAIERTRPPEEFAGLQRSHKLRELRAISAGAAEFLAEDRRPLDVSASVFLLLFDSFGDGMEVHLTE